MFKKQKSKILRLFSYLMCLSLITSLFMFLGPISQTAYATGDPTMTDYWNGNAQFLEYYRETDNDGSDDIQDPGIQDLCGINIVVANGTWYRFNRFMNSSGQLGIHVCSSTDQGHSWSAFTDCVEPTSGTPWSYMATDSSAVYDSANNKWRLIFQSLQSGGDWTMSYLERAGSSPMGMFSTPSGITNPVVHSKDIWSQIATDSSKRCVQISGGVNQIFDEGTPNIVYYDGSKYYITFHGASNTNGTIYGYRGIATTTDFVHYTAAASDDIFDKSFATGWNVGWHSGGTVGGGDATYLQDNGYWYTIIESPDVSLNCTPGQNWPLGLMRSSSLTSTSWTNFSNNPMPEFTSNGSAQCEWQYPCLFKDGSTTYLAAAKGDPQSERTFRIYRLAWKTGGYVKLLNRYSGLMMDCNGTTNSTNVYVYANTASDTCQEWQEIDDGNGNIKLMNHYSGLVLDCGNTNNGGNVYVYANTQSDSCQDWKLSGIESGCFKLVNQYSNKVIDCGNTNNGANVYIYDNTSSDTCQEWEPVATDWNGVSNPSGGSNTLFSTGFESGQTQPTWNDSPDLILNVIGPSGDPNHPECSDRSDGGSTTHTGTVSLGVAGTANSSSYSHYCYYKVFSVNIPLQSNTYLDYWINPEPDGGGIGRYVAVDFHCTDGTTLRDSGAVDQNGYSMHPNAGHGGNIPIGSWAEIKCNVGRWLSGKTVDKIWVGYDHPNVTGQYHAYLDDISIYNQ